MHFQTNYNTLKYIDRMKIDFQFFQDFQYILIQKKKISKGLCMFRVEINIASHSQSIK